MPTVGQMPTPTSTVSDDQPALDPLGRRSLYWATGGKVNDESKKRRGRGTVPLGKHAFYSHALLDSRRGGVRSGTSNAPGAAASSDRSAHLGPVVVDCSSCGARSEIGLAEFFALHFPVWLWRPGPGYARLMTCPACRRRSWLSASWRPWRR